MLNYSSKNVYGDPDMTIRFGSQLTKCITVQKGHYQCVLHIQLMYFNSTD